ncbi:MAG: 2-aminoethylphosphonate--pyruvate transaminase [Granulosicoccus sp.]|nr:2-aminoethylphosphonate--pyruvate transaminase [Granulosicoccus sp.]
MAVDGAKQNQEWLLTPGPLTTAPAVREAMLHDWGSWDQDFRDITALVRQRLLNIVADHQQEFECVPLQGSGTFVMEALLGTFVPTDGKCLVLINGAYGQRIATTLTYLDRQYVTLDKGDFLPPRADEIGRILDADPAITHVVAVHCETSSGILNPIEEISEIVYAKKRKLLIDSMSAFGALPLDVNELRFEAVASSANKCIEGVPGFGFVIARREELEQSKGRCHSLSLDLYAQWEYMEKTGQWRFTPPTHSVAAFKVALDLHAEQGGAPGRLKRYQSNCKALVTRMREAGFVTLLEEPWLSPIIVTFFTPDDPNFRFAEFYDRLKAQGFIIYPGKLTEVDSFRVGCIGDFDYRVMESAAEAAVTVLSEMGVSATAPKAAAIQTRQQLINEQ